MTEEKIKPLFTMFCVLVLITCGIGLVMFFKGRLKEEQAKNNVTDSQTAESTTKKKEETTTTSTTTTTTTTTPIETTSSTTTTTKKVTTTKKITTTKVQVVDGIELGTYTCSENCNKVSTVNLYDHYCSLSDNCTWTYFDNQLVITFETEYKKNNQMVSEKNTELFEVLPNHKLKRLSAKR